MKKGSVQNVYYGLSVQSWDFQKDQTVISYFNTITHFTNHKHSKEEWRWSIVTYGKHAHTTISQLKTKPIQNSEQLLCPKHSWLTVIPSFRSKLDTFTAALSVL